MKCKRVLTLLVFVLLMLTIFSNVNMAKNMKTTGLKDEKENNEENPDDTDVPIIFVDCQVKGKLRKEPPTFIFGALYFWYIEIDGNYYSCSEVDATAVFISDVDYNEENGEYSARVIYLIIRNGAILKDDENTPRIPRIWGPGSLEYNEQGIFDFYSKDPNGDDIKYTIDWGYEPYGDKDPVETYNFFKSGKTFTMFHKYSHGPDSYTDPSMIRIKAKAKDGEGHESDWSPEHLILMEINTNMKGR